MESPYPSSARFIDRSSEPVLPAPALEGFLAAFEDLLDQLAHGLRVDRAHVLGGDARAAVLGLASGGKADDQLGIAEDLDVGVVGGKKELPALLLLAHARDDAPR